jgi:hypothetical protein
MKRDETTAPKKGPGRPRLGDRVQLKVRIPRELARNIREYQRTRQELREILGKPSFSLTDAYTGALKYWWQKSGERHVKNFREKIAAKRSKNSDL